MGWCARAFIAFAGRGGREPASVVVGPEVQELAGREVVQQRVLGQAPSCRQHPLSCQCHSDQHLVGALRAVLLACAGMLRSAGCPGKSAAGYRY
jgi:hypothetical protein